MVKGNGIPPAASATGAIGAVTSACATASTVEFTVEYITKMTTIAAAALTDTATMTAAAMTTGRITTTLTACVHRAISITEIINQSATTAIDRKSTRLNSSHANISYAVFCLKKKKNPKLISSYVI